MKKYIITLFAIIIFCISLINCSSIESPSNAYNNQKSSANTENNSNSSSNTDNNTNNYPSLKIVCNYSGCITRVGLVGYSFEDLRILQNESKTFDLINGIPGGDENVNVNISFKPIVSGNDKAADSRSPISVRCNFTKGRTTTITLLDGSLGTNIINVSY